MTCRTCGGTMRVKDRIVGVFNTLIINECKKCGKIVKQTIAKDRRVK